MYYQYINSIVYVIPLHLLVDLIQKFEQSTFLIFKMYYTKYTFYVYYVFLVIIVIVVSVNLCSLVSRMIGLMYKNH